MEQTDGKIRFHRFTKEQEKLYQGKSADSYLRASASAGVILEFETDSSTMDLTVAITPASARNYFVHSVFVDGKRIGELSGEMSREDKDVIHTAAFSLGVGKKQVKILFPWTAMSKVCSLQLEENSSLLPINKNRKILVFGDSITQGYDARFPENSYASRLVDWLDADGINKGIGGEMFFPPLATLSDDFVPELITVAYGTNDWRLQTRETLLTDSRGFFRNLRKLYPDTPIVAFSPIWRGDMDMETKAGDFRSIPKYLQEIAADTGNMQVIDCFDFVPHEEALFYDLRLHPNDEGFCHYANCMIQALQAMNISL